MKYDHSDHAGFRLLTLCRTFSAVDTTVQVLSKRTAGRQQNRELQKERRLSQCAYFSVDSQRGLIVCIGNRTSSWHSTACTAVRRIGCIGRLLLMPEVLDKQAIIGVRKFSSSSATVVARKCLGHHFIPYSLTEMGQACRHECMAVKAVIVDSKAPRRGNRASCSDIRPCWTSVVLERELVWTSVGTTLSVLHMVSRLLWLQLQLFLFDLIVPSRHFTASYKPINPKNASMSFPNKSPRVKDAASPHQCPECDRSYERPDHLARHLDSRASL